MAQSFSQRDGAGQLGVMGAALAVVMCVALPAHAESTCRVGLHVAATVPSIGWQRAVDRVRGEMRECSDHCDCRSIDVRVDASGALVAFATRDGRAASRRIHEPRELAALVDALVVDDEGEPADPAAISRAEDAKTTSAPAARFAWPDGWPVDAPSPVPGPLKKERAPMSVGASGGAKLAWPGNFATPVFRGSFGLSLARWDASVFVGFEPSYSIVGIDREIDMSAIGGGATIGRGDPLGRFTIVYGVSAAAYRVEERARIGAGADKSHVSESATELRFGLYAGLLVPVTTGTRLRTQVFAEGAPATHVPTTSSALAAFPSTSVGLAIGMDVDLP
jgi:hypothetical protein